MPAKLRSLAATLLLVCAFLLAANAWLGIDHYQPWASFYQDFSAFLALWCLLGYWFLTQQTNAGHAQQLPTRVLVLVAIALLPLVQAAAGLVFFAGDAWMASAYLAGLVAAYSLGFWLSQRNTPLFAQCMAWLLLFAALVSAAMAFYQWRDMEGLGILVVNLIQGFAPYANLGMQNCLATLLCLGLASCLYLYLSQKLPPLAAVLLALALIFGLAMTQSRTPWLGVPALLLWWLLKRRQLPELPGKAILLLTACYVTLVLLWPQITQHGTDLVLPPQKTVAIGERGKIWPMYMDAVLQSPWWGYGWNQVSVAQLSVAAEHPPIPRNSHSHNLLLDLLLWNGLILGSAIAALLGAWLLRKAWRSRSRESWFGLLAIGFVLVHALLEFPLEYAYFLLPVGLLAGMLDADQGIAVRLPVPRPVILTGMLTSALFMGLVFHEYRVIEADYRLMRFEIGRIGKLKAEQPAPDVLLLSQLREDIRMGRAQAREGMSAEELEWMRQITYRYPYYPSLFRYAVSLALNGRRNEADREFRKLYALYGDKHHRRAQDYVRQMAQEQYPGLHDWYPP